MNIFKIAKVFALTSLIPLSVYSAEKKDPFARAESLYVDMEKDCISQEYIDKGFVCMSVQMPDDSSVFNIGYEIIPRKDMKPYIQIKSELFNFVKFNVTRQSADGVITTDRNIPFDKFDHYLQTAIKPDDKISVIRLIGFSKKDLKKLAK